ncbi:MAG: kelch repeat-containing protein, partial [Nitrososphaerales archaeon]
LPAPRRTKMAYDSINNIAILFGGEGSGITETSMFKAYDDTWIYNFDSNSWTQIAATISPPGRYAHLIIYEPFNHKTIVYGGASISPSGSDIWEFVVRTGSPEVESPIPTKPTVPSDITEPRFGGYNTILLLAIGGVLTVSIWLGALFIKKHLKKSSLQKVKV